MSRWQHMLSEQSRVLLMLRRHGRHVLCGQGQLLPPAVSYL